MSFIAFAWAAWAASTSCMTAQTSRAIQLDGNRLEAIVSLGIAAKAPIGLEVDHWEAFGSRISMTWDEDKPARDFLQAIVNVDSPLSVSNENGVLLVRRSQVESVLDTVIPEFGRHPGNLSTLDWVLQRSLEHVMDPTPQPGVVGSLSVPPGTPSIGPLNLRDQSVREVLSAIVRALPEGGMWVADGGVQKGDPLNPPIWRIVSYGQGSDFARAQMEEFRQERTRIAAERSQR